MDTPFDLIFFNHFDEEKYLTEYATNELELFKNEKKYTISVKENHDLSLLFQSADEYKLEIDLFDILPDHCFTDKEYAEEENPCFLPSDKRRIIYLNNNKDNRDYPMLVPGSYKIIITGNQQFYYAFLKIEPLRIEDSQLEIMRNEIESYLNGLSKELRSSNVSMKNDLDYNLLHQNNVFINRASRTIIALNNIINNPKYKIKRKYNLTDISKSGHIDYETIRYKQRRMDVHNRLLTYKNVIEYNIDENKMLKFMVNYLISKIKLSLNYMKEAIIRTEFELEESRKYRDSNLQLEQLKIQNKTFEKLKTLLNSFLVFQHIDWVQYIENITFIKNPRKLVNNAQYNDIYNLYIEISRQKEITIDPMKNYRYFWKESSKLYEIWGFLKLIEGIKESDFDLVPVGGWLFDKENNHGLLPFLDPNTCIVFENKDGLKIKLYYDSIILSRTESTTIDNPVYTIDLHRRPDFRIDVYVNNLYYRTIIGDFKYRSYSSLGNIDQYIKYRATSTVYRQLLDYSNIKSSYIKSKRKKNRGDGSAYETWTFYPEKINKDGSFGWDKNYNIKRIELSPGKDFTFLTDLLNKTITEIIKN